MLAATAATIRSFRLELLLARTKEGGLTLANQLSKTRAVAADYAEESIDTRPKGWWGRFIAGYRFQNLGFKRLFIVGLFLLPVAVRFVGRVQDDDQSFADFVWLTLLCLLCYLLIIRVVRWIYDGFAANRDASE
jgi:hypothetical protein